MSAASILTVPLIVTEQSPKALGTTASEIDCKSAALVEPKTKFSMWIPRVQEYFEGNRDLKNVVLFGIESHVCILQTALDFVSNDYAVYVLADGVSSMNKQEIAVSFQVSLLNYPL